MATRQQKYPDTTTFKYYNANPHGRYASDCAQRALSLATGDSWEQVGRDLFEIGIANGYTMLDNWTIAKYLELKGWTKEKQPRKVNGKKYTGKEFCRNIAEQGRVYIANIGGGHIVCILDKKVHDTWDSTGGCIGNYWQRY